MNAKVKDTAKTLETTARPPIAWGMIGSVTLAISAPFFYLNGKAYHDGYLSYFKLEPSMFPLDTSATFVTAVLAWFHAMSNGLESLLGLLSLHWLKTLLIGLGIILSLAVFNYLIDSLTQTLNNKTTRRPQRPPSARTPSLPRELGKSALYLLLPSYGLFCVMLLISLVLMTTVTPFVFVGKQSAANDLKDGFRNSPQVTVSDPDGHKSRYRVMECSTAFCALYADGKAITVPIATLDWVVSDVSDKLQAPPNK